jgi:hypothetical protein
VTPAARRLLAGACWLGLAAAVLAIGDAMTTVLRADATRDALERAYVAQQGGSLEQARTIIGAALGGAFVVGLAYTAAIAVAALLVRGASRPGRILLVACLLLALPGAFGNGWALARAVCLVAALTCLLAPPAAAAFGAPSVAAADPPDPP